VQALCFNDEDAIEAVTVRFISEDKISENTRLPPALDAIILFRYVSIPEKELVLLAGIPKRGV
jgi:hypothetical protein